MTQPPIIFSLFNSQKLASNIANILNYEIGEITLHQFPDDESKIKVDSLVSNREVIFIDSLDRPNPKLLPLLFAAETVRQLGATQVTLISPYLAYMRQDKEFHSGEGVTSKYFAKIISTYFDALITIDPHLHRYHALNEIYSIPTLVLHAIDKIAAWIKQCVPKPLLIGPDNESSQWVFSISKQIDAPSLILEKIRKGDQFVEISIPDVALYHEHTPILIDDIISTANTMIVTIKHLKKLRMNAPICISIHAIFAENAYQHLKEAGAVKIVSCNTIQHPSNEIDVTDVIINALSLRKESHG